MKLCAEHVNYWKTSKSAPDTWIDRTKNLIEQLGGRVLMEGFGNEPTSGRAAFVLAFEIDGDQFKVVWPVLQSESKNEKAAKVQAATMLYHDIKAKCISSAVLGKRVAFFSFLMLPNGRNITELAAPDLMQDIPEMFAPSPWDMAQLPAGAGEDSHG